MSLSEYNRKRNFSRTPEPSEKSSNRKANSGTNNQTLRFVIQKHDASRLHYDFRLETPSGVMKSWAVPKGLSLNPKIKRLAVLTEDHPLSYMNFEGVIPEDNYGAGTVIVWDIGTYTSQDDIERQFKQGKIRFELNGKKVKGAYFLIKMKDNEKQWLITKVDDNFSSDRDLVAELPASVLSDKTNEDLDSNNKRKSNSKDPPPSKLKGNSRLSRNAPIGASAEFPASIKPMLATAVDEPFDSDQWVFEVKWDGVRSILEWNKTTNMLLLRSRSGKDMTHRYPEIVNDVAQSISCDNSTILDGEIVVLGQNGAPDFQRHQNRMNVDLDRDIARLAMQHPATFYVFDILYLDGRSLENIEFLERRRILSKVLPKKSPSRIRISDFVEDTGKAFYESAMRMNLEGIVAKHKQSKYRQGSRSSGWLKIKGILTQDCVVIGYTSGEGRREGYFGSLILAANYAGKLRFIGHAGSGFGYDQLDKTLQALEKLKIVKCPVDDVPYINREPTWIKPELVAEVKFHGWTKDKIMRAPIFLRFRDDKKPQDCFIEEPRKLQNVLQSNNNPEKEQVEEIIRAPKSQGQETFAIVSNPTKIFWQSTSGHGQLTKADLISYYKNVSEYILPHLKDRPLSLNRYPDGINGKSFFQKDWSQEKPEFVKTVPVFSESSDRVINYIICNNKETLLWLANLGCIEMHPWHSRVLDYTACRTVARNPVSSGKMQQELDEQTCGLNIPDFIVFDLDPYIYSGNEASGQEPEYNVKGFKAASEVALDLKDLLDQLNIEAYVKTSGKTGLHVFVPVAPNYFYDQSRAFAEIIGKMLMRRNRGKISMNWSTTNREGKVFFDHNQNSQGKTVASVFSARPTESATISMPIDWNNLDRILPTDYTIMNVPELLRKKKTDPWTDILRKQQDIARLIENVSEVG